MSHPIQGAPSRFAVTALFAALGMGVLPLAGQQIYPGSNGDPSYMDVSCLCSADVPPPGEYRLFNEVAVAQGGVVPTGDAYPARVSVSDCGNSLTMTTPMGTVNFERQTLGQIEVYRGPYRTNDGDGTMTLVVAERDGLPFEPAVRVVLRGEAEARGVRFPLLLQLERAAPEAFQACECALVGHYYERIARYRASFLDEALLEEGQRRDLTIGEFQVFLGEERARRRSAFDRALGRTEEDEVPGGAGGTNAAGIVHVDDLDLLDRGVPPEMIESVHVHEEVHQRHRLAGEKFPDTLEQLAREEVEASDAQLAHLESWLREKCPQWRPPSRAFD